MCSAQQINDVGREISQNLKHYHKKFRSVLRLFVFALTFDAFVQIMRYHCRIVKVSQLDLVNWNSKDNRSFDKFVGIMLRVFISVIGYYPLQLKPIFSSEISK